MPCFFQAGQCLVVLLARELVVIDVLGILLEAQIQVDDVLVLGLILAGFVSGIGGGNLIFAQVALVKRVVSVGRADRPTGVSRLAGVHCDAFRGQALRVAGTELDQLLFRDFAVLENLGGFSATGVLDFCDFVPIRRVRGVGVRIAALMADAWPRDDCSCFRSPAVPHAPNDMLKARTVSIVTIRRGRCIPWL